MSLRRSPLVEEVARAIFDAAMSIRRKYHATIPDFDDQEASARGVYYVMAKGAVLAMRRHTGTIRKPTLWDRVRRWFASRSPLIRDEPAEKTTPSARTLGRW